MPFEWSDKPATKKDLIYQGIALVIAGWLLDSGEGAKGLEAVQSKVRALIGAAPEKKEEPEKEPAK